MKKLTDEQIEFIRGYSERYPNWVVQESFKEKFGFEVERRLVSFHRRKAGVSGSGMRGRGYSRAGGLKNAKGDFYANNVKLTTDYWDGVPETVTGTENAMRERISHGFKKSKK